MIKPLTTREFFLTRPRRIEEREGRVTEIPKGHCLVQTEIVGVCSGDVKYFSGEKSPEKMEKRLPLILGHEGTVTVLACQDDSFQEGTTVVVIPFQPCNQCPECQKGRQNYCKNRKMMGSNAPGLTRTHFVYPASYLRHLPEGAPPLMGALAEPASVAYQATRFAKGDERIAVFGTGPIGYLTAVNLAYLKVPQQRLYFFGRKPPKLQLLEDFATPVKIDRETSAQYEGSFDLVFEAVGNPVSVQQSLNLTRKGGKCVVIGIHDGPVTLKSGSESQTIPNLTEFVNGGGELEIDGKHLRTSAFSLPGDYDQVIKAMGEPYYQICLAKMVNPDRVISVRGPADIEAAFQLYQEHPHIKKVFLSFNER